MDSFLPFTVVHGVTVVACAGLGAGVILLGRWCLACDPRRERWFAAAFALPCLAAWAGIMGYYAYQGAFRGAYSWTYWVPLQVCDLASLIAPLAILLRWRALVTITYFWGLALCTQAFITPILREGPHSAEFWIFWGLHWIIVSMALYAVLVLRYRPGWRDYGVAVGVSLAYVGVAVAVNELGRGEGLLEQPNFGFLGPDARESTLVEVLGPWPWRIGVMCGLGLGVMALLVWPWTVGRRGGGLRGAGGGAGGW